MKEMILSIQPQWIEKIINGEKTVEIRKTKPSCEVPFKVYIYCTKPSKKHQTIHGCMIFNSDELFRDIKGNIKHGDSIELMAEDSQKYTEHNFLNGKVVGEFVCDGIEDFSKFEYAYDALLRHIDLYAGTDKDYNFIDKYLQGKKQGYAWHISDLVIYDNPKELSEFCKPLEKDLEGVIKCGHNPCPFVNENGTWKYRCEACPEYNKLLKPITKAPQSYCFVQEVL